MTTTGISLMDHVRAAGFPYLSDIVHVFVGGSELHGAKLDGTDDHDIYGVFVEPPEIALGLDACEHFVWSTSGNEQRNTADDVDITLYSLRKWAKLAAKGNPTCLHLMFAENQSPRTQHKYVWSNLTDAKEAFLAKSHISQFIGFVDAQLGRLTGERGRGKKGQRPELETRFGYDTKAGMHSIRLLYEAIELMKTGSMTFPRPEKELLISIRQGAWSLDKLIAEANLLIHEAKKASEESKLPDEVDRKCVSEIVTEAYCEAWGWEYRKPKR